VNITHHFPVLLFVVPIAAAATAPIIGKIRREYCFYWAVAAISVCTFMSTVLVWRVYETGPISYVVSSWERWFGIEIFFDHISACALLISALGLLIIIFSKHYIEKEIDERKIPVYYTLLLLNLGGMLGFVITGDLFNLFVMMEILSLSGYALVAIGEEKIAQLAAFKYLILGAVSSLAILMAIGFLYSITGSLNMHEIALYLSHAKNHIPVAIVAFAMFVIGFSVKAALFPLHVWLPDAHAIAPSPVSALLSGLVVKIGVCGMLRILFIYRYVGGLIDVEPVLNIIAWLAAITIVMGAFFAVFQDDIKMMLAYSTVSNIGYIFLGLCLIRTRALTGGIVHIFNHAIIKVLLFLCAGAIIYQTGYRKLSDLQGVAKKMPITMACMSIGIISIVGIPPTNGFICKWLIAVGAMDAGRPLFAAALLFGALFIFAYYIKIINAAYFRKPREEYKKMDEAPLSMLVPIVILAVACLVFGIGAYLPLAFIKPAAKSLLSTTIK
jgi:multicomponent Na+:H+ antiporter subunit D